VASRRSSVSLLSGPRLLAVIAAVVAVMCVMLAITTGSPSVVIRWTARTSLVLFAMAYIARPATQLWPNRQTKWLLRERTWLGNGFAASHLAHLLAILVLASGNWSAFVASQSVTILFALVAYVVLFTMSVTSIRRIRKAMPREVWLRLHATGMHMMWIVFASTYFARIASGPIWIAPSLLLLALVGVRVAAWRRGLRVRVALG
jgi:methionine sulfoxide reductase heme-binding subunit